MTQFKLNGKSLSMALVTIFLATQALAYRNGSDYIDTQAELKESLKKAYWSCTFGERCSWKESSSNTPEIAAKLADEEGFQKTVNELVARALQEVAPGYANDVAPEVKRRFANLAGPAIRHALLHRMEFTATCRSENLSCQFGAFFFDAYYDEAGRKRERQYGLVPYVAIKNTSTAKGLDHASRVP